MRFQKSIEEGSLGELTFENLMSARGWKVEKSTFSQNVNEHWDYSIEKYAFNFKVDVKAKKRISRADLSTQTDLIWVELKNVRGREGWLYGQADFVAFSIDGGFGLIRRHNLIQVVDSLLVKEYVDKASDALYKLYQRRGRQDLITMVRYADLKPYINEVFEHEVIKPAPRAIKVIKKGTA